MDLFALTAGVVGCVNPRQQVTVQIGSGVVTNPDGSRTPSYGSPVTLLAQVQRVQFGDITEADSLQIQGERQKIYLYGDVEGLVRSLGKGSDLITLADGTRWKVALVLERYPNWTSALITRMNP